MRKQASDKCGIYAIEHLASHQFYIGSSVRIYARWYGHRLKLNRATHHAPHLQHTWTKYGSDAFEFYILEECSKEDLLGKEQEYIDAFNPVFNHCPLARSRLGSTVSQETKEKIRLGITGLKRPLRSHCKEGHLFDETNTYHYTTPAGGAGRGCRKCRAACAHPNAGPNNRDKTHCKSGHPLSGDNLIQNDRQRICRECRRTVGREWARRKAAARRLASR